MLARSYAILQEPVSGAVITSVAQAASGMAIRGLPTANST